MAERFLRNTWYCGAESGEVTRTPFARTLLNEAVVFFRKEDGAVAALGDACPHRRAPLSKGVLIGDTLRCPYHGLVFDTSGACVWMPGKGEIPDTARTRAYPTAERHGWVWIWMGEPARADVSLIPDFSICVSKEWATLHGVMKMQCGAMLMVDNLMDLQHVAYVHPNTIGNESDNNPDLTWKSGDGWVSGTRIARDLPPAPQYAAFGVDLRCDETKVMTYSTPSNVVVDVKIMEAGKAYGEGRVNTRFVIFNLMTPETDNTHHYFWAATRDWAIDDAALTEAVAASIVPLVKEDKDILEWTQAMLDMKQDGPVVNLRADTGSLRSRRMLDDLIKGELQSAAA